jgi:putative redox protein
MEMEITFPGGKIVEAHYEGSSIKTDQPIEDGGTGTAPCPFDLFLASIATCTGYYVLNFCQNNNIPTHNIRLSMTANRNKQTHLIENIPIKILIPIGFPEKYKKALVKVADVCSVKKHLEHPPQIDIIVDQQ